MKLFFISMVLFIALIFIIPTGGMCEHNVNHENYMYSLLFCEILCIVSIVRVSLILKKTK
jgi:hypothetical protein